MELYISGWTTDAEGTFVPVGYVSGAMSAIDLRHDPSGATGKCLLVLPSRPADETGMRYLGTFESVLDTVPSNSQFNTIEDELGLPRSTLNRSNTVRQTIADILVVHADEATRWRPIVAGLDSFLRIYLNNQEIWSLAVPAGGIADNFDRANSTTIGTSSDGLFTWTENDANWGIRNNRVYNSSTNDSTARAEYDLASADHFSQFNKHWQTGTPSSTGNAGPCVRFDPAADTCYVFGQRAAGTFTHRIFKRTNGSGTTISTVEESITFSDGDLVRIEAEGSTIRTYFNGVLKNTATDSSFTSLRTGIYQTNNVDFEFDNFSAGTLGNQPPNAPTLVAPSGGTIDMSAGYTFDWTFSDPDAGDTQSEYSFRRTTYR